MPPPGVPLAAAAAPVAGFGSSFLTGLGSGLASAVGGALGGSGNSIGRRAKDLKRLDSEQKARDIAHFRSMNRARMQSAKELGLHPLVAMGIAPAGSTPIPGNATSNIPGQHDLGGAVASGINAYQSAERFKASTTHASQMANLQVKEQELRNDWLQAQIKNAKVQRIAALSNAAGRGQGMGPSPEGTLSLSKDVNIPTGTTTSAEDAENRWWEIGGAAMGILNIGYDLAGALVSQATIDELVDSISPPGQQSNIEKHRYQPGAIGKVRGYTTVYPPSSRQRPKYPTHRRISTVGRYRKQRY